MNHHAHLFSGPPSSLKREKAMEFIAGLLGTGVGSRTSGVVHPDLIVLDAEEGKKQISIDQVRELKERVFLKPAVAPRVVAYLPHADRLNESGMNALLKVLEEPPAGAIFVLVAEDVGRFPATLMSRVLHTPVRAERDAEASSPFVEEFLLARTLGARLRIVDELAKNCDASEDPEGEWRRALRMNVKSDADASRVIFGIGLLQALRSVGSSISPRIMLEATAVRMSGAHLDEEARRLMPTHVPRTMPLLFGDLV